MLSKKEAIEQITDLMDQYAITVDEIKQHRVLAQPEKKQHTIIKKFFAFLGGIFILCGVGIYVGEHWGDMNSAARIIITLGTGILFYILAIVAASDQRYINTLTPLFLLAALFEAGGMFVAVYELFHTSSDPRYAALIIFGTLFLQQILTYSKIQRSVLIFTALIFGFSFMAVAFSLLDVREDYVGLIIGVSLMLISYALSKTVHASLTPFWYLIGSILLLTSVFALLKNTPFELFYFGVTILVIYLSTIVRSRMLLFTGTVAMIVYIGYFTQQHFLDSIGWPIALIVFGLLFLGISALAVKIGRKM